VHDKDFIAMKSGYYFLFHTLSLFSKGSSKIKNKAIFYPSGCSRRPNFGSQPLGWELLPWNKTRQDKPLKAPSLCELATSEFVNCRPNAYSSDTDSGLLDKKMGPQRRIHVLQNQIDHFMSL
jgi:hypothetical protein